MSAIRTENLVKKFRRVEALNGLNLDVPEGAVYALVGPNGAGKTTAIKILMNSFYGVLGTPACRFYNPALATKIPADVRHLIEQTEAGIRDGSVTVPTAEF